MALLSGHTPIGSDCRACAFAGPSLVDQLEAPTASAGPPASKASPTNHDGMLAMGNDLLHGAA